MERYTKAKFTMKVTYLKKEDDKLKVVNSKTSICRGSDFSVSMAMDQAKGIHRKIQYVNKEPENFAMDTIYILLDGTKVWVYTEYLEPSESSDT